MKMRIKRTTPSRGMDAGFRSTVRARRSIRRFAERDISDITLRKVLDVVRYIPSSLNAQPVEILILRNADVKKRIVRHKNRWCPPSKKAYKADFLSRAPVILVVCVDSGKAHERHLEIGLIASAYLLLSTSALGLGSTFLTAYNVRQPAQVKELKKILRIPPPFIPVSILPIGYPAEKPRPKKLRALRDILHHEAF